MKPIDTTDQTIRKIRMLVYLVLRERMYLHDLSLAPQEHSNLVKIACPDDRSFMTEASWIEELHEQHNREIGVMPNPMFGGAMRFSEYCPEMPDDYVGFKCSPNAVHRLVAIEKCRFGISFRGARLVKAGGHGLFCGWASALGLGFFQHTRLTIDGRRKLKEQAKREHWLAAHPDPAVRDQKYQVFAAHHMDCTFEGQEAPRTYGLDHHHKLVQMYPMELVMERLTDLRFLELEAPHLLKQHGLE